MGRGNMWVYKHPGLFPVKETVKLNEHLPPPVHSVMVGTDRDSQPEVSGLVTLLIFPPELVEMILERLPPEDALHLVCASGSLYRRFRSCIDMCAYSWVQQGRPWYLPVGPIQCPNGNEEVVRWQQEWKRHANLDTRDISGIRNIPWLAYHLVCRRSPNMRSRERIWGIVLQIKDLLECSGVLLDNRE